jgi:hypothetical protein
MKYLTVILFAVLLSACGTLQGDALIFKTADPHISIGIRLLPAPEVEPTRNDDQCLIKGNVSSTNEKIYHMPGSASYDRTTIDPARGEMWLCSEAAAVDAGFRKALR